MANHPIGVTAARPGAFSVQAAGAGLLAAFVGFASTFTVIIHGLTIVGATPSQAATGLLAVSVVMGVLGIGLSLWLRTPIAVAWSTPGAVLLGVSGAVPGGFPAVVGSFLVCGLLIMLAGAWPWLGRMVARIPLPIASAMLAGILLDLCLAPVRAVAAAPGVALPVILAWALVGRWRRVWAVPAAVATAAAALALAPHQTAGPEAAASVGLWPGLAVVAPSFPGGALLGLALPLFVVTMASQNIPGIAILGVNGYRPAPGLLFRATGLASLLTAPFGGVAVNLAAITAAMCAGPDADPDPTRRYWSAVVAGCAYVVLGLFAGVAAQAVAASPPILIEAVAGLALLGAFASAIGNAVADARDREAAVVTFVVAASGVSFLGVGGASWGLVAGGAMFALSRIRRPA